jgi:hypothetical protein
LKHIGIVKADTLISIVNWMAIPLFVIYVICMIIAPWIKGRGDWVYVQDVWDRWQSLNVGALALISSMVAFNISRYNENKKRERDFIAARAFLPEALSELTTYFKSSGSLYTEAWENAKAGRYKTPLQAPIPSLPTGYKETFSRCISLAEPDVGERLAYMLMRLQVQHSRLQELANSFKEDSKMMVVSQNIITYLYRLAELLALTYCIFPFARGSEEFNSRDLVFDDFQNAYGNLDIWVDEFDDLAGFTQRAIARGSSD